MTPRPPARRPAPRRTACRLCEVRAMFGRPAAHPECQKETTTDA